MRLLSVLVVGGLVLAAAACGKPPASNGGGASAGASAGGGKAAHACMVTDIGGINDRSFNASAWAGMQAAQKQNPNIKIDYTQSAAEADYGPNLNGYVQQKCDLIVAVGGLMAQATTDAAKAAPSQKFGIIDAKIDSPNVYSMQFDTAQAAFLAGYLAAGMSKTGVVGTYGGLKIPPVTIFMDGFADAVRDAVLATAGGSLQGGGGSVGTLKNNGVQLADFHEMASKVPADLKTELDQLKQDIISGKVQVSSPAQPK